MNLILAYATKRIIRHAYSIFWKIPYVC